MNFFATQQKFQVDPLIRFLIKAIANLGYIRTDLKEGKSFAKPWMPLVRQFAGAKSSPILMALMNEFRVCDKLVSYHEYQSRMIDRMTSFVYCADRADRCCAKALLLPFIVVHLTEENSVIATKLLSPLFRIVYPDVVFANLMLLCNFQLDFNRAGEISLKRLGYFKNKRLAHKVDSRNRDQ